MSADYGRLRQRRGRRRAAISLTPLVDVVFILVIFFMLASSFARTNSLGLVPPATSSPARSSGGAQDVMVLRLLGDQALELDGEPVEMGSLATLIRADGRRKLLLLPQDEAALQDMVTVLDITEALEIDGLSIAIPPEEAVR